MNTKHQRTTLAFPTQEFRSLPIPGLNGTSAKAKLSTFFVDCGEVPWELDQTWMKVNPRVPKLDDEDRLKSVTGKAIVRTLLEEPSYFALKNQGIWLLAESAEQTKESGGKGVVRIVLDDPERHGVANGGHTLMAVRQAVAEKKADGALDEWGAFVRFHVLTGIDPSAFDIAELAEGLNRSLQVDDPSLENLRGQFDAIKKAVGTKKGHDQIIYKQGQDGEIEVVNVLSMLSLFDLDRFPDRKTFPNGLFGHTKAVLQNFVNDKGGSFDKIVPRTHELLVLSEKIQAATGDYLGKVKVTGAKSNNRLNTPKNQVPTTFTTGTISKRFPLGWLYPMLGAFRANMSPKAWKGKQGKFEWIAAPESILDNVAEEMASIIYQEHKDNKGKPAEVGRKEAAYRLTYGAVMMELVGADHELK